MGSRRLLIGRRVYVLQLNFMKKKKPKRLWALLVMIVSSTVKPFLEWWERRRNKCIYSQAGL